MTEQIMLLFRTEGSDTLVFPNTKMHKNLL